MKNSKIVIGGGIAVVLVGIAALFFGGNFQLTPKDNILANADTLEEYAKVLVGECKDAPHRPTCYEEKIPEIRSEVTAPEIFEVIRLIRKYDPEYLFCHVLAHQLGEYEVSLDPSNWLDAIAQGPTDGLCSNGFSHGAIVTRFNEGELTPEEYDYALTQLAIACEEREGWDPTNLMKAICYHGVGHVMIHMTEADVDMSLDACEEVALKDDGRDYRQLCVEGVYMQLFQPLEPEDFALVDQLPVAPTRDNIHEFCSSNSNDETQYAACWREAWPLFYEELFTVEGVLNYCSELDAKEDKDKCFVSAFTINGRHNLGTPDKMASLCNGLPTEEYQSLCLSRGANAFPEENPEFVPQAIDMCGRGTSEKVRDECYAFLAGTAGFNFHPGSEPFEQMCTLLPEKWESTCRRNGGQ